MDLKQIQYFVTVVEQGSINRAAQKLHMTQPPVSKQMQLLEAELGCPLFLRSTHPLELTQEGKVLYERGLNLLAMAKGTVPREAPCVWGLSAASASWQPGSGSPPSAAAIPGWPLRCMKQTPISSWSSCAAGSLIWPWCGHRF